MNPLLLMMPAWAQAAEPTVLSLPEALRLVEAADQPPKATPPPAWTAERSLVSVSVEGDEVRVVEELYLRATRSAWIDQPILDGKVRLDTRGSAIRQGPDGNWWLTTQVDGPVTFRLEGTLPRQGDALTLKVFPAARQEVRTSGEGLRFEVEGSVQGFVPPTDQLAVSWRARAPRAEVREVVTADVAAASWWEDDAMHTRARVRYEVRRGERSSFSLRIPAGAQEPNVSGSGLLRWERSGDTLLLTSREPVRGAFEVTVDWRQPFASGLARLSAPEPTEVTSSSATLTLAGSSETLLSPTPTGSLRTVALSEIPERNRAIGDETPAAAWSGRGVLEVRTLNLESIEGPPLVIDRARCTEAYADSGRSLMNCRLDVRNISRQYLVVRPGEGTELWAARVNGDGVPAVRLEGGDMAIPLEKSVETVAGLITLDVELTFLSKDEAWLHRGERALSLPSFDAPVARLDWELRLPPGFEAKPLGGTTRLTEQATSSIVYATTAAEISTESTVQEEAARASWNQALRAYQQNDFETAQTYVDQTIAFDPNNENASRLQENLDVLMGEATGGEDEAMSRRVKDMAKAKVSESEVEQEESMNAAEEALMQGDYDKAIAEAEKAIVISKNLSLYEQKESNEQAYRASSSAAVLDRAREGKRSTLGSSGSGSGSGSFGSSGGSGYASYGGVSGVAHGAVAEPATAGPVGATVSTFEFEDMEVEGELLKPDDLTYAFDEAYVIDEAYSYTVTPTVTAPAPPPPPPPETALLMQMLGTTGEGAGDAGVADLFSDGDLRALDGLDAGGFGLSGVGVGGGGSGAYNQNMAGAAYNENTYILDGVNIDAKKTELNYDVPSPTPSIDEDYSEVPDVDADGIPDDQDTYYWDGEEGGVEGGVVGGVIGGVFGGAVGGQAAPTRDTRSTGDDLDERPAPPPKRDEGRVGAKSQMTVATGNGVTRAPSSQPASTTSPATPRPNNAIPTQPPLASTTLAIPLPDHGDHIAVSQSLLEPWESPTLTLRYREKR